jgi:hypothetical protein
VPRTRARSPDGSAAAADSSTGSAPRPAIPEIAASSTDYFGTVNVIAIDRRGDIAAA